MAAPIEISGLPVASIANDADQTILRQGITDFSITIGLIRNINIQSFPQLPSRATQSDYLMINRTVTGTPTNFRIPFSYVGLPKGVQIWFYMTSSQISANLPGWSIVPSTGDTLLACQGGSTYTTAASQGGTWTQTGYTLSIDNLPPHTHSVHVYKKSEGGLTSTALMSPSTDVGFASDTDKPLSLTGSGLPVQPGNTWRPFASVGNICKKLN